MRLFISMAAAFVLGVCVLAACSPQDGSAPAAKGTSATSGGAPGQTAKQTATPQAGETRRVSIDETQKAVAAGTAVIVDVRDAASYKTSHIKGSISIPLQQIEERIGELPKDKLIITYCA
jgi:3-mercaptopyruvate sulfurtransferase SseA